MFATTIRYHSAMNIEEHVIEEPAWLRALVERLVKSVDPMCVMGPFGYRFLEPETPNNPNPCWVIAFYPTPSEACGGPHDGGKIYPGFSLKISHFLEGFCEVLDLEWRSPAVYNGELDGPEFSIKGTFVGEPVWVRIFNVPPNDEEPTLVVDLASGNFWERKG